ncbi:MAG: transglutaminase-like cysteine peptidase [Rhodobacteraceae bacterium]|nr:transglutaminase-like cysteine peptidase [Paracoccaceae bacterium]
MVALPGTTRPTTPARRLRVRLAAGLSAALLAFSAPLPALSSANSPTPYLIARKAMPAPAGFGALCASYAWLCARSGAGRAADASALRLAEPVNRRINHQVRQIADRRQYGRDEVWALPTRQGGDCEDIAMLKKLRLIEAGIAPEHLLVATALDLNRSAHAVLILRTSAGDYVLDNLRDRIRPWQQTGYSFLLMQDPKAPARWTAIFAGGIFS